MNLVSINDGVPVTNSMSVADTFGKLHKNVLRDIQQLECSTEFAKLNFELCYENNKLQNGKPLPYYNITRDGFFFLAMGFTGPEAAQFKETYIAEFNRLETELRASHETTQSRLVAAGREIPRLLDERDKLLAYITALESHQVKILPVGMLSYRGLALRALLYGAQPYFLAEDVAKLAGIDTPDHSLCHSLPLEALSREYGAPAQTIRNQLGIIKSTRYLACYNFHDLRRLRNLLPFEWVMGEVMDYLPTLYRRYLDVRADAVLFIGDAIQGETQA